MEDIRVDKDIDIPAKYSGYKSKSLSILAQLNVGDSVLITDFRRARSFAAQLSYYKREQNPAIFGKKFTQRTTENGIRFWRVA